MAKDSSGEIVFEVSIDDSKAVAAATRSLQKITRNVGNFNKNPIIAKNFTQPLGRITGAADEFTKSLEASNARVLAFGASAGAIFAVQKAMQELVKTTISVEQALTDINVLLNVSDKDFKKFSDGLFEVARKTGTAFGQVAESANEFARQGLKIDDTLKRTSSALALSKLGMMDSVNATESLTAALNTFKGEVTDAEVVVNKLAQVDAKFAVSSKDLAEAIKRTGASARGAKVSFEELLAAVTVTQERTARGGAVIGNAFKTIFTRIQRPEVLAQLKNIGVEVKDASGEILPAIQILKQYGSVYDSLTPALRSNTAQLIAGGRQINILKALMPELASGTGKFDSALRVANETTTEATDRLSILNSTSKGLLNGLTSNLTKTAAEIGNLTVKPAIDNIISALDNIVTMVGPSNFLGLGETVGKGIYEGIGKVISGPGILLLGTVIAKLGANLLKFVSVSGTSFLGLNKSAESQANTQTIISNILAMRPKILEQILSKEIGIAEGARMVNKELAFSEQHYKNLNALASELAAHQGVIGSSGGGATKLASGLVPNFVPNFAMADAEAERKAASKGGYQAGQIRRRKIEGVGNVTYNGKEKVKQFPGMQQPAIIPPALSQAGKEYRGKFKDTIGFDPYNSAFGFVPNFTGADNLGNIGAREINNSDDEDLKKAYQNAFNKTNRANMALKSVRKSHPDSLRKLLPQSQERQAETKDIDALKAKVAQGTVVDVGQQLGILSMLGASQPNAESTTSLKMISAFNNILKDPSLGKEEKKLLSDANITFKNIQVSSLTSSADKLGNTGQNHETFKNFQSSLRDTLPPVIADLSMASFNGVLGSKGIKKDEILSKIQAQKDNLIPPSTEGELFEASARFATQNTDQIQKALSGGLNSPFDFEQGGKPDPRFAKAFFGGEGFDPTGLLRADAKRTADPSTIRTLINKSYNREVSDMLQRGKSEVLEKFVLPGIGGDPSAIDPETGGTYTYGGDAGLYDASKSNKSKAALGFVPNFSGGVNKSAGSAQEKGRLPLTVLSQNTKPNTGFKPESKFSNAGVVKFISSVGNESFSNARTKSVNDPKSEGKALQVLYISAAPEHLRGKGYGKDLYNYMFNFAKRSGHDALLGDTSTSFSAMHVVKSISKGKKFETAPGLTSYPIGNTDKDNTWGTDGKSDWTYRMASAGFVPNFSLKGVSNAIKREDRSGVRRDKIRVGYDRRLAASGGIGVYNTDEGNLGNAINMHMAAGRNKSAIQTQGKAMGFTPNFAQSFMGGQVGLTKKEMADFKQGLRDLVSGKPVDTKPLEDLIQKSRDQGKASATLTSALTKAAEAGDNASERRANAEALAEKAIRKDTVVTEKHTKSKERSLAATTALIMLGGQLDVWGTKLAESESGLASFAGNLISTAGTLAMWGPSVETTLTMMGVKGKTLGEQFRNLSIAAMAAAANLKLMWKNLSFKQMLTGKGGLKGIADNFKKGKLGRAGGAFGRGARVGGGLKGGLKSVASGGGAVGGLAKGGAAVLANPVTAVVAAAAVGAIYWTKKKQKEEVDAFKKMKKASDETKRKFGELSSALGQVAQTAAAYRQAVIAGDKAEQKRLKTKMARDLGGGGLNEFFKTSGKTITLKSGKQFSSEKDVTDALTDPTMGSAEGEELMNAVKRVTSSYEKLKVTTQEAGIVFAHFNKNQRWWKSSLDLTPELMQKAAGSFESLVINSDMSSTELKGLHSGFSDLRSKIKTMGGNISASDGAELNKEFKTLINQIPMEVGARASLMGRIDKMADIAGLNEEGLGALYKEITDRLIPRLKTQAHTTGNLNKSTEDLDQANQNAARQVRAEFRTLVANFNITSKTLASSNKILSVLTDFENKREKIITDANNNILKALTTDFAQLMKANKAREAETSGSEKLSRIDLRQKDQESQKELKDKSALFGNSEIMKTAMKNLNSPEQKAIIAMGRKIDQLTILGSSGGDLAIEVDKVLTGSLAAFTRPGGGDDVGNALRDLAQSFRDADHIYEEQLKVLDQTVTQEKNLNKIKASTALIELKEKQKLNFGSGIFETPDASARTLNLARQDVVAGQSLGDRDRETKGLIAQAKFFQGFQFAGKADGTGGHNPAAAYTSKLALRFQKNAIEQMEKMTGRKATEAEKGGAFEMALKKASALTKDDKEVKLDLITVQTTLTSAVSSNTKALLSVHDGLSATDARIKDFQASWGQFQLDVQDAIAKDIQAGGTANLDRVKADWNKRQQEHNDNFRRTQDDSLANQNRRNAAPVPVVIIDSPTITGTDTPPAPTGAVIRDQGRAQELGTNLNDEQRRKRHESRRTEESKKAHRPPPAPTSTNTTTTGQLPSGVSTTSTTTPTASGGGGPAILPSGDPIKSPNFLSTLVNLIPREAFKATDREINLERMKTEKAHELLRKKTEEAQKAQSAMMEPGGGGYAQSTVDFAKGMAELFQESIDQQAPLLVAGMEGRNIDHDVRHQAMIDMWTDVFGAIKNKLEPTQSAPTRLQAIKDQPMTEAQKQQKTDQDKAIAAAEGLARQQVAAFLEKASKDNAFAAAFDPARVGALHGTTIDPSGQTLGQAQLESISVPKATANDVTKFINQSREMAQVSLNMGLKQKGVEERRIKNLGLIDRLEGLSLGAQDESTEVQKKKLKTQIERNNANESFEQSSFKASEASRRHGGDLITNTELIAAAQEKLNNSYHDGSETIEALGEAIGARFKHNMATARQQASKSLVGVVDDFKEGTKGAFFEAIKGTKTLREAFGELFDRLADRMLKDSLDAGVDALFGAVGAGARGLGKHFGADSSPAEVMRGGAIGAQNGMYISGNRTGDLNPAMLEDGEYVFNRNAVKALGGPDELDRLNFGMAPRFRRGGVTGYARGDRVMKNRARPEFVYNDPKSPTSGEWQGGSGLSSFAMMESGSPMIAFQKEREKILERYIKERAAYDEMVAKAKMAFRTAQRKRFQVAVSTVAIQAATAGLTHLASGQQGLNSEFAPRDGKNVPINNPGKPDHLAPRGNTGQWPEAIDNKNLTQKGGFIKGFAQGGRNRDNIHAVLGSGEYVVNKQSVDKYGVGLFNGLNNGTARGFAEGGPVGASTGGGAPSIANNNFEININITGDGEAETTDASSEGDTTREQEERNEKLGLAVQEAVQLELIDQQRPGGLLYREDRF